MLAKPKYVKGLKGGISLRAPIAISLLLTYPIAHLDTVEWQIPHLIDIRPPIERALLVGAPRRGSRDAINASHHLDELERLADTAGATVVGRMLQQVGASNPKYYIGSGKLDELRDLVADTQATLVILDEDLAPGQGKNLERGLDIRVMDRSELILDIFASRAKSKEAKMQVELAQLEYLLPRLARMWVHLSRIRGGIGLRGPGETQLETDRRMIRRKISSLKKKLERVARHREVVRTGRQEILTAALVGYTNAGKSSLLRAVTGADPFIEDRLFATLDTLTRETAIPTTNAGPKGDGKPTRIRLIDTVGFIRKLPHDLVASFRATLEEAVRADALLHVIDASHQDWEEHVEVVNGVLNDLDLGEVPVVHVFNKMDKVEGPAFREATRQRFHYTSYVSAAKNDVVELRQLLERFAQDADAHPSKAHSTA